MFSCEAIIYVSCSKIDTKSELRVGLVLLKLFKPASFFNANQTSMCLAKIRIKGGVGTVKPV